MTDTVLADPAVAPRGDLRSTAAEPEAAAGPRLKAIIWRLSLSILMANVIPGALFYLCLVAVNVWTALIAALVWCYGAITWRMATRRRASALLFLTVAGLTARTAFSLVTGGTYVYFLQPVVIDGVLASLFFVSLATARPVVARMAADFYPMSEDIAKRPRVQRLFWNLTLLWAVVCLVKGAATLWLLQSQPMATFVAMKSVLFLLMTVCAVVVTVWASVRVARQEGLMTPATTR